MTKQTLPRRHVIIGTAGHIDHGKTALVKALTGIDADTLTEEKRRGITIELGFIFMDTPDPDRQVMFIDVPGHEQLVKTMVAGASNIDAALLVIAADEGISVQTREHFDILKILGVPNGVIALTKADLVNQVQIESLEKQILRFVAGSFLEKAPVIPVSSVTGDGIKAIKNTLLKISRSVHARQDIGVFRMPVDRVFTMKGFGTVIAGTVLSGSIRTGDEIEILPEKIPVKIRGVQVHHENAPQSSIGKRTALNLAGVEKSRLHRGQCAAALGFLHPTNRLDARLYVLESGPDIKHRTRLRFHTGTSETIGRIVLLDRDILKPGETAPVQFVLESETTALPGDRYVIRTFSPVFTAGGGVILDAVPGKHRRKNQEVLEGISRLEGGPEDRIEQMIQKARYQPCDSQTLSRITGLSKGDIAASLEKLLQKGKIIQVGEDKDTLYIHLDFYLKLGGKLSTIIQHYLEDHPDRPGISYSELRSKMLEITEASVFKHIQDDSIRKRELIEKNGDITLAGYSVGLTSKEAKNVEIIKKRLIQAGFEPPLEEDLRQKMKINPSSFQRIMADLISRSEVKRLSDKVTYPCETLAKIQEIVLHFISKKHSITIAQLRDKLGLSRKYSQAILEYMDNEGLTKRVEDKHVLPGSG